MSRKLIILRHAHRDTSDRNLDNGLSSKGLKQVDLLKKYFQVRINEDAELKKCVFLSSPKKRCLDTLEPLSKLVNSSATVNEDLNEQSEKEKFASVEQRVHRFIHWWSNKGPEILMISSHGDILPLLALHMLGTSFDIKKGSWLEIDQRNHHAELICYIRSFKFWT